jgi:hypothetical protein
MLRTSLAALLIAAALPAAAQEMGGLPMRMGGSPMHSQTSELGLIAANQGCPMSSTSVTVGLNKATAMGSSAQQQLATQGGGGSCRPLVSTQVVAGVNLALGRGSSAGQTVGATGPSGVLATNTFTRGYNIGYGAGSTANQRILNQISR